MTILFFLAAVILVSIIASILVAVLVIEIEDALGLTFFGAGLVGVALCFALAYAGFFIMDPDPPSEFDAPSPLYLRTLPITGLSAMVWLPIYMTVLRMLKARKETS